MAELRKAAGGQPLVIPAGDYNAAMDAARDYAERKNRLGRGGDFDFETDQGMVIVKNVSGFNVTRFGILGIDSILFTPTESLAGFQNQFCLTGATPSVPDHTGKFVIAAESIPAGKIGRCYAQAVCPVQINVTDEGHAAADVADGDAGALVSSQSGAAQIIYKEDGAGLRWALVRLGTPIALTPFPAIITDHEVLDHGVVSIQGATPTDVAFRWKYAWEECSMVGDTVVTSSSGSPRLGTFDTDYALNLIEYRHTARYSWGRDLTGAAYQLNERPKAIGGAGTTDAHVYDVPVLMFPMIDAEGVLRYRFSAFGTSDGTCDP